MERENLPVTICLFLPPAQLDRKSTRLNSSHGYISYAVFCLKKKKKHHSLRNVSAEIHLVRLLLLNAISLATVRVGGSHFLHCVLILIPRMPQRSVLLFIRC